MIVGQKIIHGELFWKRQINVVSLLIPFTEVEWECSAYKFPPSFKCPHPTSARGKLQMLNKCPYPISACIPAKVFGVIWKCWLVIWKLIGVIKKDFCYILRKFKEKGTCLLHKPACKKNYVP